MEADHGTALASYRRAEQTVRRGRREVEEGLKLETWWCIDIGDQEEHDYSIAWEYGVPASRYMLV